MNDAESYIYKNRNMDKKFAKQFNNIDKDYFVDEPKDVIFSHFF